MKTEKKNINSNNKTNSEWADLIDEAKDRIAINDLSVISYRILDAKIQLQIILDKQQSYGKNEFCKSVGCVEFNKKCHYREKCKFTAKEFHHWLKENNFRIVKNV